MAITDRETVKKWFETGDKPTQTQFYNLFDSIWFKNEKIPSNNIDGLNQILISKVDRELFDRTIENVLLNTQPPNLQIGVESFLNRLYMDEPVYGILLTPPAFENESYLINHDLNIDKYLQLQVWEDGLPFQDPMMKAREDLTQLVYEETPAIGDAVIGETVIGADYIGSILLSSSVIRITGNYRFPNNKLIYIEYTKRPDLGNQL